MALRASRLMLRRTFGKFTGGVVAVDNTTEFHMSPQTLSRASLFPQKNRKIASSDSAASPAPSQKKASSAESVGRFWFREPSQVMIQGNFHGVEGAKAVGSSGNYTDFVVETFHGAIGDFPFRPHPGHPFDRLQFAAHGPEAPIVEKGPGPDRGFVPPEMNEIGEGLRTAGAG